MIPLNFTIAAALTIACAYFAGSVPFGYLIGRLNGKDIRKLGSGNIGATNVTRTIGKWWGKTCFLLDFLKGAFPVFLAAALVQREFLNDPFGVLPSLAAFAAVSGHIWPVWLGFKGGKGVSTAAGAILALNPLTLLCAGIVWVAVFLIFRYVSLASILASLLLPVFCQTFSHFELADASKTEFMLFCLLALLTVTKHRSNIRRLLNGSESKFERKSKLENPNHE